LFNFSKKLLNMELQRKEYAYFDVRERKIKFDRYSWSETIKWMIVKLLRF